MFNNNQNYNSDNIKNNNYSNNNCNFWSDNNYRYNDDFYYNYNNRYDSKRSNNSIYKYNKDNIKNYNYSNINNYKKYNNANKIKQKYYNNKNYHFNHNYNDYFDDEMNRNKKENYKNKYNDNDENSDYEYNYHDFYSDGGEDSSDDFNEEEYYEKLTLNDKSRYGYMYELPDINQRLIILDTEVSGRNLKDFNLLEVCAYEMINGKITNNKFHSFFKPKNFMSSRAIKKHKVPKKAFYYTKEEEIEILLEMRWFIGTSLIITHNASYDLEIINKGLERYDLPKISPNQYRCSMRIFLQYYPKYSSKFSQLKECCKYLKIKYRERRLHLGSYDAYLVCKVMKKIYRDQIDKNGQDNIILSNDESIEQKLDQENYMIIKKYEDENEDEDKDKENSIVNDDNNINKLIGNIIDIKEEKKKDIKDIDFGNNFIENNNENLIAKKEKEDSLENFINENIENIASEMPKKEKNNFIEMDYMGEFIKQNLDEILFLLNQYNNEEYLSKKRKLN